MRLAMITNESNNHEVFFYKNNTASKSKTHTTKNTFLQVQTATVSLCAFSCHVCNMTEFFSNLIILNWPFYFVSAYEYTIALTSFRAPRRS